MTRKIKYNFHDLRIKDPLTYKRKLMENPICKKNAVRDSKKFRDDHLELCRKREKECKRKHKIWIIRNCIICGRFCSKLSEKFCKFHSDGTNHNSYCKQYYHSNKEEKRLRN